ncbi:MAG: nucleotidyltransferase domain-containing protein [Methyloprofundus sp.]|nr:nucleotidyltransferase domain-containing protein [Methyloprofundus sp.]
MRLSKRLETSLIKSILESFGEVDIYLFGSRTDDTKKGGDIDIAVDVDLSRKEFQQRQIKFMVAMIKQGLELKIDLVAYKNQDKLLTEEIKKSAIKLRGSA